MDQASHIAKSIADSRSIEKPSPNGSKAPQLTRELAAKGATVWEGLRQIFGTSFTQMYGPHPTTLWLERLDTLTLEQITDGLKKVAKQPSHYPCNLTEFMEACKSSRVRFYGVPTPSSRQISQRSSNRRHIDTCLANMREAVKLSIPPTIEVSTRKEEPDHE